MSMVISSTRSIGFLVLLVICFVCTGKTHGEGVSGTAETAGGKGIFAQTKTPITNVTWRGQTLIEKDTINYIEPKSFADTGKVRTRAIKDWEVVNTLCDDPNLSYRKEVGVRPDRVELSIQMTLPAYKNDPDKEFQVYSFLVPRKLLEGMKWKALIGHCDSVSKVEGELTDKTPDGDLVGNRIRWIAFEGDGKNIVFDLDPKGLTPYAPGSNGLAVRWEVHKEGDYLRFSVKNLARQWGGICTGKVIIFEGTHDDYLKHHTGNPYYYFGTLPAKYNFSFGQAAPDNNHRAVHDAAYDRTKGYGWETSERLEKIMEKSGSLVYSGVASAKGNTFMCDLDQPGLYIVRLLASNCTDIDRGSFSVSSNGELKAENIAVPSGKIKTVTYSQWLPAGTFRLKLDGSWILSGVSLQMLLHKEEDFGFNRGMWLVDGEYEPTPILSSAFYRNPPQYQVAVAEMDLPPKEVVEPKTVPTLPEKEIALPDQKSPNLAWRYDGFIGGMGQDNCGTFLEYDTPEKITRRLKELKADGVNVVLLNGFLARHCHKEHLPRVQKTVKEIVRIAHELGMRVLDHQELTILWNMETSLRTMVENIDWCQRTVDGDAIVQGWCPLNPDFQKKYFAHMKQYVDDTQLDGIMIDEVCYHLTESCGCPHCRAQFTKETGLVLPLGENFSKINNKSSLLFKAWQEWRLKAIGDWWIAFRKEVLADRPDFCVMGYMCEDGVLGNRASLNFAYDLFGMARSNDFVGTEIMARNVMANYRFVSSTRRLYNVFRREYGSPVFGLVYHYNDEHFGYFGWAMNNMLGQATWDFLPISQRKHTPNFLKWRENMDKRLAKQLADVAIVFSVKSRDRSRFGGTGQDGLGISQTLTDNHIQHLFLTERSLKSVETLKEFRLVILPSDCCLDDAEFQVVREYAEQGGRVLVTGYTGQLDAYGQPRSKWGLADILKCEVSADATWPEGTKLATADGGSSVPYSWPIMKIDPKAKLTGIFLNAVGEDGKVLGPVCFSREVGKGTITYCATQIGVANFQTWFQVRKTWEYEFNPQLAEFQWMVIRHAAGNQPLSFEPVQMPAPVITTLWQQESDGSQKTLVHFLNATGVRIEKGDAVPCETALPAFPLLDQDMIFEINLPSCTKAYAVSPDFDGHKSVKVEKVGDIRYRVTVPKDAFKAYTMVVLE